MSETLKRFDLDNIQKAVAMLFAGIKFGGGECIELRVPDKRKKITAAGWFDNPEALATAVAKLAQEGFGDPGSHRHIHENVYWTINPVHDALLARQPKNTISIASETTTDANITRRIWLPIDIDPLRAAGVSATDAEKKLARKVAEATLAKLQELGFADNSLVGGSSGNGYHVLLRLPDLPNDDESRTLLKRCLAALQVMVGNENVEIDSKVFNAGRILKAHGTLACKGENTAERPWRMSGLTIVPEKVEPCSLELLQKLAALAPATNSKRNPGEARRGPWNLESLQDYLTWTGWDAKGPAEYNGGHRWVGTCIADDNHPDAAVLLGAEGKWVYTCFHSSCEPTHSAAAFQAHWEKVKGEKYPIPGRDLLVAGADSGLVALDLTEAAGGEGDSQALVEAARKEPKRFNSTDSGNSERLVYLYGPYFRYCPQRGWYAWTRKRWAADDMGMINRAALNTVRLFGKQVVQLASNEDEAEALKKWALKSEMRAQLSNMVFLAQSASGVTVRMSEFDTDPWLFNVQNGTVDLRTGELRPHNQADMLTNISPVKFDPNAACPLWEGFLHDIMAGNREMIDFLQRAAGYSLTGITTEHCLFMLWGSGRNGKSTFLEALKYVLGTYGTTAAMSTFMESQHDGIPNDLAALAGARFVTATESKESKRLDEAKLKQVTGGDTITARFLHKEFFEYRPQYKIWLATNHRPAIMGTDEGIWRRLRLVPFTVYIPDEKKDEKLPAKLQAESAGILAWALRGLEEYREHGLMEPEGVIEATAEYREAEDWLTRFLDEHTERKDGGYVQARKLYTQYCDWAKETKEQVRSERRFAEALQEKGFVPTKKTRRGKEQGRFYDGLELRNPLTGFASPLDHLTYGPM
jgi:P4 family phage/plasmid primase-like protien